MALTDESLDALRVPIDTLNAYGKNPRRGDVRTIARSLKKLGQYRPVVVNRGTHTGLENEILAGNHTVEAARQLGWTEVAATFVDVDADTAARIVLVDNRANDVAGYDDAALLELLQSIPDLEGTGFNEGDLADLLGDAGLERGKTTEPTELPAEPTARRGDVYVMGDHRLVCGDSTDPADVARLLDGDEPTLLFTDPPYGMDYKSAKLGGIQGDKLQGDDLRTLVREALGLGASSLADGAAVFVWCTWRTYPEFVDALRGAGLFPSACIVWKKGRVGPGNAHYRPEHEFCLYCGPQHEGEHDLCIYCAGETWQSGRGESDVWEVSRDTGYVHPTQKPVALAERAIDHTTRRGDVVLDLFGGSGSTLLAAHNLARKARLMELDPGYVDVIVDRWERHSGRKAELIRDHAPEATEGAEAA